MENIQFNAAVSIIVPMYNSEKYLRRCLDSILNQTFTNFEVLLVDDGSTDKSKNICEEYFKKDCRIKYIYQENKGAGIARNTGIEHASSKFLTFLDSDDSLEPLFIECIIGKMLESEADIGICDINYINTITFEKKVSKIRFSSSVIHVKDDKKVFNSIRTFAWGKIYKKELFDQIRYPDFACFEDLAVTPFVAAIAERIAYVPLPLINYYRNRSDSLSENPAAINNITGALKSVYERLHSFELYDDFQNEYKKCVIGQLRFLYRRFENSENKEAIDTLKILNELVFSMFPGLSPLMSNKFYIYSKNELLATAVDKAVIHKEQIVNDINIADYAVCFEDEPIRDISKPVIKVNYPNFIDEECAVYDIAEDIIMSL